ncbi:MAG: hypothetical protein ACOC4J_06720 [Bacteroidota bacterium]
MNPEVEKKEFDSSNILTFLIRWWKHLGIVCFLAAIVGVIVSSPMFITPLFQSSVLMFPAKSNNLSKALFGQNIDFLRYGDVDDAERLLQVLESTAIRDRVVERFNLLDHYEIPEDSQYKNTELRETYNDNISARRTPYGAVEINVRDKDPQMAADIANEIAALADTIQNDIRQQRALQAYEVAKEQFDNVVHQIDVTDDSLKTIMQKGIYEYEAQAEMLTRQLAMDLSTNNTTGIQSINEELEVIRQYGGTFLAQKAHLEQISRSKSYFQRVMDEARADLDNFVSFKFIIDDAFPAEKKVYPTRWLIVFLTTFAAGFFGIIALMIYENLMKKGIISGKK